MIKGNALIGQSGGPTSVINSSLAGVIETALSSSFIEECLRDATMALKDSCRSGCMILASSHGKLLKDCAILLLQLLDLRAIRFRRRIFLLSLMF